MKKTHIEISPDQVFTGSHDPVKLTMHPFGELSRPRAHVQRRIPPGHLPNGTPPQFHDPATEIGAGTVNVAKMVRGGSLWVRWGIMISPPGEALSFGVGPKPMEIELPFIQNGGNFGQSPFWRSVIGE